VGSKQTRKSRKLARAKSRKLARADAMDSTRDIS
jgi:hypothetical protein